MSSLSRIFFALSVLAVTSCSTKPEQPVVDRPDDKRILSVENEQIDIDHEACSIQVKVTTNIEYSVQIADTWIAIDDSDTSDDETICFKAERNDSAQERRGTIKLTDINDRYYYITVSVVQKGDPNPITRLTMVDKRATDETEALYANLWAIADKGFMFGHHDDLWYGRYWYNEPGASDTKAVCGDYPAVFSVDFGPIMDNRYNSNENQIRRRVIIEAHSRGEVVTACCHLNNPLTGGDSWDNSNSNVVRNILTEGNDTRTKYLSWLDRLADFALNLKDDDGKLVPILFRPYHEHTQSWSWWGSGCTTENEFIAFWQMTVKYLRDTKGVHNFIYAISPQMDAVYSDARGRLTFRWPGDSYVDFIGMDCYHGTNNTAFVSNLSALSNLSNEKMKPCGVTETGKESFTESDFWTRYVLSPTEGQRISMVVMWRNKFVSSESDKHYYSVYPGHSSEADFVKMYETPRSIFSRDLPDMYSIPDGISVE